MLWWTLRQLRSSQPGIRRRAAIKLCNKPKTRWVGPVVDALREEADRYDSDETVCEELVWALGKIGPPAIEPLKRLLDEQKVGIQVHRRGLAALTLAGEEGLDSVVEIMSDTSRETYLRELAAEALAEPDEMGLLSDELSLTRAILLRDWQEAASFGAAAVGPLLTALDQADYETGLALRDALIRLGRVNVEPLVSSLSRREPNTIHGEILFILEGIRDRRATPLLVRWVTEARGSKIWGSALRTLVEIDPDAAVEPLLRIAQEEIPSEYDYARSEHWHALLNLSRIGGSQVEEIIRTVLQSRNINARIWAAECLRELGVSSAPSRETFMSWLLSGEYAEKVEALIHLGKIGDAQVTGLALSEYQAAKAHPQFGVNDHMAYAAAKALERLVERLGPNLAAEDLQELARLGDLTYVEFRDVDLGDRDHTVDCSRIRALAADELKRRGHET